MQQSTPTHEFITGVVQCLASDDTEATATDTQAWRSTRRPLVQRVADLVDTIPAEVQQSGIELRDLQRRLVGRQNGKQCHCGELGHALRQLGFRRERRWIDAENGFRAIWKRN